MLLRRACQLPCHACTPLQYSTALSSSALLRLVPSEGTTRLQRMPRQPSRSHSCSTARWVRLLGLCVQGEGGGGRGGGACRPSGVRGLGAKLPSCVSVAAAPASWGLCMYLMIFSAPPPPPPPPAPAPPPDPTPTPPHTHIPTHASHPCLLCRHAKPTRQGSGWRRSALRWRPQARPHAPPLPSWQRSRRGTTAGRAVATREAALMQRGRAAARMAAATAAVRARQRGACVLLRCSTREIEARPAGDGLSVSMSFVGKRRSESGQRGYDSAGASAGSARTPPCCRHHHKSNWRAGFAIGRVSAVACFLPLVARALRPSPPCPAKLKPRSAARSLARSRHAHLSSADERCVHISKGHGAACCRLRRPPPLPPTPLADVAAPYCSPPSLPMQCLATACHPLRSTLICQRRCQRRRASRRRCVREGGACWVRRCARCSVGADDTQCGGEVGAEKRSSTFHAPPSYSVVVCDGQLRARQGNDLWR